MDEVFGNNSGHSVVAAPLTQSETENQLFDTSKLELDDNYSNDNALSSDSSYNKLRNNLQQIIEYDQDLEMKYCKEISSIKNKTVDLDQTQDLQIDQNSENHHLEEIQKMSECDKGLDEMYLPEQYLDDIKKNEDNSILQNSTLQNYLSELGIEINGSNEKYMDTINDKTEKLIKSILVLKQVPDKKLPNYQKTTRNQIYQLPPMRHTQSNKIVTLSKQNAIQSRQRTNTSSLAVRHLYQNLPLPLTNRQANKQSTVMCSPQQTLTPTYVNVPMPRNLRHNKSSPLKHSYIQLWSGSQQESSEYGTDCDEMKTYNDAVNSSIKKSRSHISSPGYVQMSSPYVRSPVSSVFSQLACNLANYAGHAPQTIFCPMCPLQFSNEAALATHIQRIHKTELGTMIDGRPDDLAVHCCPICQARFFNKSVLPKHITDFHKDSIIQLLEKHNYIKSNIKGMQCPFCSKCVPSGINGEHIMLFHLQQYHQSQFDEVINDTFLIHRNSAIVIIQESEVLGNVASATPELSNKLGTLLVTSDCKRKLEDVEKEEQNWPVRSKSITGSSIEKRIDRTPQNYLKPEPRRSVSKGILRRDKTHSDRPNVKRELRFSVPHVTREKLYFPESPGPMTPDEERVELTTFSYPDNNLQSEINPQEINMDAISTEECIDMDQQVSRKRRRIALSVRTKNIFKCKDKENSNNRSEICEPQVIQSTSNTRTFRRPKPIAPPQVPIVTKTSNNGSPCASKLYSTSLVNNNNVRNAQVPNAAPVIDPISNPSDDLENNTGNNDLCPFSSVKLYSPLRLFRCNSCRHKFCDNESLLSHISQQHRGLLSLLRPQFGCGVCSAKFYENKQLVKHCLQHHTSLLEIREPSLTENQGYNQVQISSPNMRKTSQSRNNKQVTAL